MTFQVATRLCWICGKTVTPITGQEDEHGYIVHAHCHSTRQALIFEWIKLSQVDPGSKFQTEQRRSAAPTRKNVCG